MGDVPYSFSYPFSLTMKPKRGRTTRMKEGGKVKEAGVHAIMKRMGRRRRKRRTMRARPRGK